MRNNHKPKKLRYIGAKQPGLTPGKIYESVSKVAGSFGFFDDENDLRYRVDVEVVEEDQPGIMKPSVIDGDLHRMLADPSPEELKKKFGGNPETHCAPDTRSFWKRLKHKLFPAKHCFAPDAPKEFKDCIHGHAVTKLDFADRIRVLLTGVVVSSWRTVTENEVGRSVSNVTCHIGTNDDWKDITK